MWTIFVTTVFHWSQILPTAMGAIYWRARKYVKPSIIYFDLAEEIFHELPWPESVLYCIRDKSSGKRFYTSGLWELGTFGEHLCLSVCTGKSRKNLCVQLWEMKESWTRLATIPYLGTCLWPMCESKNGEKGWNEFRMLSQIDRIQFDRLHLYRYIIWSQAENGGSYICGKPLSTMIGLMWEWE